MFSRQTFSCHLDARLWFTLSVDNAVDLVDFTSIKRWKCLFDFQDIGRAGRVVGGLSVRFGCRFARGVFSIVTRRIFGLEVFRDGIYLLIGFSREGRERRGFVDSDRHWFGYVLLGITGRRRGTRGEFVRNFVPKCVGSLVSV